MGSRSALSGGLCLILGLPSFVIVVMGVVEYDSTKGCRCARLVPLLESVIESLDLGLLRSACRLGHDFFDTTG